VIKTKEKIDIDQN